MCCVDVYYFINSYRVISDSVFQGIFLLRVKEIIYSFLLHDMTESTFCHHEHQHQRSSFKVKENFVVRIFCW